MILKKERNTSKVQKELPNIGVPYKKASETKPHKFYEHNKEISSCIAGYQQGANNPYVEYLMHLGEESTSDKKKILTK